MGEGNGGVWCREGENVVGESGVYANLDNQKWGSHRRSSHCQLVPETLRAGSRDTAVPL